MIWSKFCDRTINDSHDEVRFWSFRELAATPPLSDENEIKCEFWKWGNYGRVIFLGKLKRWKSKVPSVSTGRETRKSTGPPPSRTLLGQARPNGEQLTARRVRGPTVWGCVLHGVNQPPSYCLHWVHSSARTGLKYAVEVQWNETKPEFLRVANVFHGSMRALGLPPRIFSASCGWAHFSMSSLMKNIRIAGESYTVRYCQGRRFLLIKQY